MARGPPGEMMIDTRSPAEAIDFVVACIVSQDEREEF